MLTFKTAREILAKYAGRGGLCADNSEVPLFVIQVMQHMLFTGAYGNLRKFCFCAVKGCFTVPYELETIEKVKIDNWIGSSWDRWYEFHAPSDAAGCVSPAMAVYEDPNYYPTVYDPPTGGARIGIMGTCNERADANIIIKGLDPSGREIITTHQGQQVVGEYLTIQKGIISYTQSMFASVTAVVKSETNGYTPLYWILPASNTKGFLADYSPLEQVPAYRRYRLTSPNCQERMKVTVLGRIRLKEKYVDNDVIPFENIYALNLAGQEINANFNREPDLAMAANKQLAAVLQDENAYKKPEVGQPMEVFLPLSGGSIANIIGGRAGRGWW